MNLRKACEHLIAECNQKGHGWHAIMMQERRNPEPPFDLEFIGLVVHVRPGHESKWRNREQHFGWPVEVHPWPKVDL